jgi:hypothetical protein
LSNNVCERRGEFDRKRRSDAGRAFTDDEKEMLQTKLLKKGRVTDVVHAHSHHHSNNNNNQNTNSCGEGENAVAILTADEQPMGDEESSEAPEAVQV